MSNFWMSGKVETARNGAVLMLELGKIHELDIPNQWNPQLDD